MQLFIDFLPVIIFFIAYKAYGMYVATVAIMIAMAVQIGAQWILHRKINKMLLVSGVFVAVLGGITLALRNPLFLQWKPTIVNWLFAAAFLGSQYIGKKTLIERVMGQAVELDTAIWRQLNWMWVANFAVLGALNLYVVYNFSEETWVNFKLFGIFGITILTAIGQALWITARTSAHSQSEN
jgi:intracellular septation protein